MIAMTEATRRHLSAVDLAEIAVDPEELEAEIERIRALEAGLGRYATAAEISKG